MTNLSPIQFYVDPFINPNNKLMLARIETFASKSGLTITRDLENLKENKLPTIIVFEEDNNKRLDHLIKDSKNFPIQIEQPNMDLFSKQGLIENTYLIKTTQDLENALETMLLVFEYYLKSIESSLNDQAQRLFQERVSLKQVSNLKVIPISKINEIVKFESLLTEQSSFDAINKILADLPPKLGANPMTISSLREFLQSNRNDNFFVIPRFGMESLYFSWDEDLRIETTLIYFILREFYANKSVLYRAKSEFEEYEECLSKFSFPIAIFDDNEEILIHNTHFVDLGISSKACLKYEDSEQMTLNKVIYRIVKKKTVNNFVEMLFIPANDFLVTREDPSFEEMGIISSSIAHELNNPLAGISAAIDYLLLDDLNESVEDEIMEMKKGVVRCRNLIKTFLSFSNVSQQNCREKIELESCLGSAFDLLRFRLIENNLNLKIDYKVSSEFNHDVNDDVFTMLFYLVLGDIITNFSHHKLVSRGNFNIIDIVFEEFYNGFNIQLPESLSFAGDFFESKLVNHLFELTHMKYSKKESMLEVRG